MFRFDSLSLGSRLGGAFSAMRGGLGLQGAPRGLADAVLRAAMPAPVGLLTQLAPLAGALVSRSSAGQATFPTNLPVAAEPNQCSVLNLAKELAPLANNAYNPSSLRDLTLERSVEGTHGFAAAVYKGQVEGRQQIVIAMRGTDDDADWGQNRASVVTVPEQYDQALALVREVAIQNPGAEIILTGHSLGGALAAYSGILADHPAMIFNAAGTDGPQAAALGPGMNTSAENIVQVNASCDALTQNPISRRLAGQPWNPRATYVVESEGSVWNRECHSMDPLNNNIQRLEELTPAGE
ncbi:MAG: DUF2974 domain-containing protein [Phycisphaerales bacterium]|nr:DUF2974 domain-containing protein [Phycisphaerales bacterium]